MSSSFTTPRSIRASFAEEAKRSDITRSFSVASSLSAFLARVGARLSSIPIDGKDLLHDIFDSDIERNASSVKRDVRDITADLCESCLFLPTVLRNDMSLLCSH